MRQRRTLEQRQAMQELKYSYILFSFVFLMIVWIAYDWFKGTF